jgi:hypothetical protein
MTLTPQLIWTTKFRGICIFWLTVAITAAVSLGTSGGGTAIIFPDPWTVVGALITKLVAGGWLSSSSSSSGSRKLCAGGVYGGGSPLVVVVSVMIVVDIFEGWESTVYQVLEVSAETEDDVSPQLVVLLMWCDQIGSLLTRDVLVEYQQDK